MEFLKKQPRKKALLKTENKAPIYCFERPIRSSEHSGEPVVSIGFIQASDEDGDEITYTIESAVDLDARCQSTGELKVGGNIKLDYETVQNMDFTISAFDGKTITEKEFTLTVEDVDETTLLTEDQKELITYFQHLVFWKEASNSAVTLNQKWGSAMKLYLDGTISDEFETTVESVIAQYNVLFVDGDFSISLVENPEKKPMLTYFLLRRKKWRIFGPICSKKLKTVTTTVSL